MHLNKTNEGAACKITFGKALVCYAASVAITTLLAPVAAAQSLPVANGLSLPSDLTNLDSSRFSQDVTDAVTQGFRNRDRSFFEDGIEQFEHSIEALQQDQPPAPILTVDPTPDAWQQFFEDGTVEPN